MLFSSTIFLFYFLPLVLALYYTVGESAYACATDCCWQPA